MMTSTRILAIVVLIAWMIALTVKAKAQSIIRKGNTFIELPDSSAKRGGYTKTKNLFTNKNGRTDTIYLSSKGKAFVFRTSKKTGKTYRQYLPEITKMLNKNVSNKNEASRP